MEGEVQQLKENISVITDTFRHRMISQTPPDERQIISVCNGGTAGRISERSFMSLSMALEAYNLLKVKMPQFLVGQQFDVISTPWTIDCFCEDCWSHEWVVACTDAPIIKICGYFIFRLMPHQFWEEYL